MKSYAIGDYSYDTVSRVLEMLNQNCDNAGEDRIPMRFFHNCNVWDKGWYIECLHEEDESRLEKHLDYIYGLGAW